MTPAAIQALREADIQTVARCAVQPGDVLVVTVGDAIRASHIEQIVRVIKDLWPGHQVLVLAHDMTLDVIASGVVDES
jgi:hypothetical protein